TAPLRGVVEFLRDLFDCSLSLGTVHHIVRGAVAAAEHNDRQDLGAVRVAALDETFQAGRPVLVGCDVDSPYCFLLSQVRGRDCAPWGVPLLEAAERGLARPRPSPTAARVCLPATRSSCRTRPAVRTSSTPCTTSSRWCVTWKAGPTRPSPPATGWRRGW